MDRHEALRILGLPDSGQPDAREIAGAYWRLRARVDPGVDGGPGSGVRATERERGLAALAALGLDGEPDLSGLPPEVPSQPSARRRIAAVAAAVVALGMLAVAARLGGGSGSRPSDHAAPVAIADGLAPARLELRVGPPGAAAVLVREGDVENVVRADAGASQLELEPGSYAVRASHPDCSGGSAQSLALTAGELRSLELDACPATGWIVLGSNVAGDSVSIDGVASGASGQGAHALPAGEHALRIEKSGYVPWQGAVEVPAGETVRIRAELIAQTGSAARQTARSEPRASDESRIAAAAATPATAAALPNVAAQPGRPEAGEARPDLPAERWTQQVREFLLRYDADRSGALDRESELAAVPCDEWLGIQGSHDRSRLALPFTRLYGFDGSAWKGDVLGIDASLRDVAHARLRECGVR